jgi:hypothetical protein
VPRLVGKQSNTSLYVGVALLLALMGTGVMEYFGVINVIPGFGSDPETERNNKVPTN